MSDPTDRPSASAAPPAPPSAATAPPAPTPKASATPATSPPPAGPPIDETVESHFWLTRSDQLIFGLLSLVAIVLLIVHWIRLSHWGTQTVEIERLPARQAEFRLDANAATWVEWSQIQGIGDGLARRIVADREQNGPFSSVDDLARVKGIGPKNAGASAAVGPRRRRAGADRAATEAEAIPVPHKGRSQARGERRVGRVTKRRCESGRARRSRSRASDLPPFLPRTARQMPLIDLRRCTNIPRPRSLQI